MFRGSIPALVTTFRDEAFDEGAYRDLVDWQIAEGSHGLVPCGTTGESATLTAEEHYRVVEICVEQADGRVPVIAGCGSNSTQSAIQNMKAAKERGADAALCVAPYYNRPSQAGLLAHFSYLAEHSDLPIICALRGIEYRDLMRWIVESAAQRIPASRRVSSAA